MDTYIKDVVKKLEAMMPEKEISSQKIQKNNGIERVGILIKSPEQNISPVLYISKEDAETYSADEIAKQLHRIYLQHSEQDLGFDVSRYTDYDGFIKHNITFAIVSRSRNKDVDRPAISITPDLQAVFRVYVGRGASIPVRAEHIEMWGNPSVDELMELAVKNSAILDRAVFESMEDALFHIVEEAHDNMNQEESKEIADMVDECVGKGGTGMYILTNESKSYGASCILYEHALETIRERLKSDLIIIPSSVHETIITSTDILNHLSINEIMAMIKEVNSSAVSDIDYLSDKPLMFDATGLHEINANTIIRDDI